VFAVINTGAIIPSFLRGPGKAGLSKIYREKKDDEPLQGF
jgi:hypothetical protein